MNRSPSRSAIVYANFILQSQQAMRAKILTEAISFSLMALFTYASFSKIADYRRFSSQIKQSPILTGIGDWLPGVTIVSELLIVIFLVLPQYRPVAFKLSYCLLIMFSTYILFVLNFTIDIPCSCGGILEKLGWTEHLLFNFIFIIVAAFGIHLSKGVTDTKAV